MSGYIPNEAPSLERLLGLKLSPVPKWNSYIRGITKDARKNGQFLVSA